MKEMSGRRVGQKVFDWVKLASRVPEEAKADFSAFRARHESYRARYSLLCVYICIVYRKLFSVLGVVH